MRLGQDGEDIGDIEPRIGNAPVTTHDIDRLSDRIVRIENHLGLNRGGPPQLALTLEDLAKVAGLVSLDLTDDNIEALRRVVTAANLVAARIV